MIKHLPAIRHKLTTFLVGVFVVAFVGVVIVQKTDYHPSSFPAFHQVQPGMAEAEVVRLLGHPDAIHTIRDRYDLSYKVSGYTFRAFKSGGTVYVYQKKKDVCYVLLNEGRVSEVVIGYK